MYRIALCDDDQNELDKAGQMLEQYKEAHPENDFMVCRFTAIEPLLVQIEQRNCFDILLLDIYLPGKTGIDGYRELRQKGFECPVIFLTTSLDHAVSAFQVNAVQYLVKPVEQADFFAAMDKVFLHIAEEHHRYVVVQIGNELRRITLRDILYCESQKNNLLFNFTDGTRLTIKMTMTELCEKVSEFPDFARVGIAYMVNLSHVNSITAKEIHLDNSHIIWMPRGAYPSLKGQYFAFFCDREGQ